MLHAVLHHKLDETTPEPQRLEDALTSTVFGTLKQDEQEVMRAVLEGDQILYSARRSYIFQKWKRKNWIQAVVIHPTFTERGKEIYRCIRT